MVKLWGKYPICAIVKSRYIGDGHPTFNRNPYNGYIKPYYWVDDHPLLYGNNGSLDPSIYTWIVWPIQNSGHHQDYFRIGNPYKPLFPLDPKHGWLENPLNFGMVFTRKHMDFTWWLAYRTLRSLWEILHFPLSSWIFGIDADVLPTQKSPAKISQSAMMQSPKPPPTAPLQP